MYSAAVKLPTRAARVATVRPRAVVRVAQVVRAKHDGHEEVKQHSHMALAAMCAAALLTSAVVPDEALAARSGGRVGGSSFSARRSAPSRSAPAASGPTIRNNNYYAPSVVVAPPLVGGFGFPGYAMPGFGFGFGPTFVMPGFGFLGSLVSLFFFVTVLSFVFNVIRTIFNSKNYDD